MQFAEIHFQFQRWNSLAFYLLLLDLVLYVQRPFNSRGGIR